jgi:hypothetical protein
MTPADHPPEADADPTGGTCPHRLPGSTCPHRLPGSTLTCASGPHPAHYACHATGITHGWHWTAIWWPTQARHWDET